MVRTRLSAALLLLGGCLSTPDPASGPGEPVCGARDARPVGQAWPPPGIDVWSVNIADVDRDGIGDLVVSVGAPAPRSPRPAAVYVLYGPVSPTAPEYHVALDLDGDAGPNLQPWATSLDDVDGDGCLDLTIAGPPTDGFTQSAAAVFRHGGTPAAWTGPAVTAPISFEPWPGPTMVAWAELTVDPAFDLVVADLYNIDVLAGSSIDALGGFATAPRPICNDWNNINAIRTQPRGGGRDRLLVFGHHRVNTVTIDDNGTFTVSDNCNDAEFPLTRGVASIDLDGTPPLDLLSGGAATLGAHLIADQADPISPANGAPLCDGPTRELHGFAAGDLGGTPAPDAVVLLHDPAGPASFACLVSSLTADADTVSRNGFHELALGAGIAHVVAVGNVSDRTADLRAWILDTDGTLHCVRRSTGANTLVAC